MFVDCLCQELKPQHLRVSFDVDEQTTVKRQTSGRLCHLAAYGTHTNLEVGADDLALLPGSISISLIAPATVLFGVLGSVWAAHPMERPFFRRASSVELPIRRIRVADNRVPW